MEGTTELLKRLDSDGEPFSKRLCLAQNVFQSIQLPLPKKEETVTKWLCQVADKFKSKNKRRSVSNSPDDFATLWSTFLYCVKNPRFGHADIRPSTKTYIIEVLSKQLKRKDLAEKDALLVLECAVTVFRASIFKAYFISNISLCVDFANILLKSMSVECAEHTTLIHLSLLNFQKIIDRTKSKNELGILFLDEMLFTMVELLKNDKSQCHSLSNNIYKCVKLVLHSTISTDFAEHMNEIFCDSVCSEKQHIFLTKLLNILEKARSSGDDDSSVILLNLILNSTLHSWKTIKGGHSLAFSTCVFISYFVGFEVTNEKNRVPYERLKQICSKGEIQTMSLSVLRNMVHRLSEASINLTIEMNGTSLKDWLSMLVESLFDAPSLLDPVSLLKLMSSLVQLFPHLVEKYCKMTFDVILAKPLSEDLIQAYTSFLSEILALFSKLNRVPHFTEIFVKSLQDGFKKQEESGIFPPSQNVCIPPTFIQQLSEVATVMPSASSTRLLKFLLHQCEIYLTTDENNVKYDASLHSGYKNLLIHTVSELISAVFRGVRLFELSTTENVRKDFCFVLRSLSQQLNLFGKFVLKDNHNKCQAVASFLNVAYHWAAQAILIEQYADAGRETLLESVGTNLQTECQGLCGGGILTYLHPYLSSSEWESIYDKVVNLEDEECKSLLLKLDFQLLSALLMFNSSQSTSPKVVAKRACSLMVQRPTDVCASSIDRNLLSNVILMAPLLDVSELSSLGDCLSASLIVNENYNSLQDVMAVLIEERLISCALVCSILRSLRRKVKASKRKKDESGVKSWKTARAVLSKLDAEVVINQEIERHTMSEEVRSMISSMASPVSEALLSLNGCQKQLSGEEIDLTDLLQHLQFLRSFPLSYLTTGCQDVVFLSLFSVAVDCSFLAPSQKQNVILKEIFDHLLLGLYARVECQRPNLTGFLEHGALIGALAYFVVNYNVGRRLLELLLGQALRQQESQEEILEKILSVKDEIKKKAPSKETMLLGTLFLQVTSGSKSNTNHQNKIMKARKKIARTYENLIQNELINCEEGLCAFTVALDFNMNMEKDVSNLLPVFERFCRSAVSLLHSSERREVKAAECLILTVCRHRQDLTSAFPNFLIKDVWAHLTLSDQPNEAVLEAIVKAANEDETSFIISDLLSKTQLSSYDEKLESEKCLSNIVQIWSMLLRIKKLHRVHSLIPNALKSIFGLAQQRKVSLERLLGLVMEMLQSHVVKVDMETLDLCFLILHNVQLPQEHKEFVPAARQFLSILSAIFLQHLSLALDCVPSFLQMLRHLVNQLAQASKQSRTLSRLEGAELAGIAFEAEKLVKAFTKPDMKNALKRVAAYFVADLIAIFETTPLCSSVKKHYENMVYGLMSILDRHANKFLARVMSPSSHEIFKSLQSTYTKFHLFTGNV